MKKSKKTASRLLTVVLAFVMTFTGMNFGMWGSAEIAWAAEDEADQSQAVAYASTVMLSGSGTEEDPYLIGSAEDFAAMPSSGYSKLKADIEVNQPYKSTFRGNFDGNGYTVTLKLNVTSGNAGLFAETGYGAVIHDVIVDADVTSTVASSSYGTGGLIGKISGTSNINNCGVNGSVKNTATSTNSAVYAGGLIGYINANCTIDNSYASCSVENENTSSSSSTGGLIGKTSNYYTLGVNNCYASGNVTAKKGYAGGITGYVYCSSNYKHTYSNCYAAGQVTVTSASANAYGFAYSYASAGFSFTNCFYNNINAKGFNNTVEGITEKTSDELKNLDSALGDTFQQDKTNINNGYPILSWQYTDPDATCSITFNVMPKDSELTWNGEKQPANEDGIYTFENVKVGNYAYNVANEAGDYTAQSGTISAKGKNLTQNITLQLNKHNLTFELNPADMDFQLKSDNEALKPVSGTSYSVVNGTYTYEAKAFGYKQKNGSVEVNRADKAETVKLEAQPVVTVTFAYDKHKEAVSGGKIEVTTDGRVMDAKENSDGMVYELPAGYSYAYKFTSGNYARQTGTIDLTAVTEKQDKDIKLPMQEKTAWEGADDITEPSTDADGVYQISSGSELAWLAQQINSGKNAACKAVLTKDIDLGGKDNWTPIGKSFSYAFKGNFDGQGHKIENIYIDSTSDYQGLFGYVNNATIRNVTLTGQIKGGNNTAGFAANFAGTSTIEKCVNKSSVAGGNNVGGIVGNISTSTQKNIREAVNEGNLSGANNVGGIVGYAYYKCTVEYCYNRGNVSVSGEKAGGIVGYMNDSGAEFRNCYTTGSVSGKNKCMPVVGMKSSGKISGCYYLDTLGTDTDTNATSKTSDELKALASALGGDFIQAPEGVNDGYPILKFQIPTYDVRFTVNDENAVVSIDGQEGSHAGNIWSFKLPDGTYRYIAFSYGMLSQEESFTVQGAGIEKTLNLEKAPTKQVTFDIKPSDANETITIMQNGQVVESGAAGKYTLPYGTYTYQVKAKGYAKVSESLTVDKASESTVTITLVPSTAWDGETKTQPAGAGTESSPYQIEDGEQLAWLADAVNNASSATTIYAELTDNIDLGSSPWTPIGKDFHEFQGTFNGNGFTISGLKVTDVDNAGLFGVVNSVEIKNLVVSGTVSGTANAGGIAGKMKAAGTFSNCGNEASVKGESAGGILGRVFTYGINCTFEQCYNAGKIDGTERAGGILAHNNGSASNLKADRCYNIGDVSSKQYAGGVLGGSGLTITNSYTAGKISGNSATNSAAFSTAKYDNVTDCFYLAGTANDNTGAATAVSSMKLQQLVIGDDFEHVNGRNKNYPVLKWQKLKAKAGKAVLAKNAEFKMIEVPTTGLTDGEEDTILLTTPELTWKPIDGAEKYVVTIWENYRTNVEAGKDEILNYYEWPEEEVKQYLTEKQFAEYEKLEDEITEGSETKYPRAEYLLKIFNEKYGNYELETKLAAAIYDVEGTKYDCTALFDEMPEGVYYAAVVPMDVDGNCIMPGIASVEDDIIGYQSPYNRLKKVTGLEWNETRANWDAKANFNENDMYTINLYTVFGDGSKAEDFHFYKSFEVSGSVHASDFRNAFAAETDYAFTVIANVGLEYQSKYGLTDSPESEMSPIYKAGSTETPGEDHEGWTAISSAAEWIKLANVKDDLSDPDDTSSPSKQEVEWSKNYYLTADLDFSELSAADQVKTKSIGNVNNRFMGTLDGNGHKIKGLTLSNSDAGLFWYVGSTGYIYDLTIENANVLFSDNAAVIAQMNYGKIENCGVINCNITADIGAVMGGMVSRNYGIIRDSYVQGGSLVSNSKTATGHAGFVGDSEAGSLIERCWTSMNVKTTSDYAGGFVGLGYGGTIRDCFALGTVSARSYSGGFAGRSVFNGNTYENCYAAGKVTVSGEEGHGFIGGNKPGSSFQYDQSKGIINCYYNAASPEDKNGAAAKTLSEMKEASFLTELNKTVSWSQDADKNNGLPYLTNVKIPEELPTSEITVKLALATYDKTSYEFKQKDKTISVTMESNGNTRLVDLMDEAEKQGLLTYAYDTTASYGRFIKTINDYSIESPDGWMFTINDNLSNVSASLATVKDGDKVLWFEGTTENHFQGPTWDELGNPQIVWTDISTRQELEALAASTDAETLAKNYRLANDIDLSDKDFAGIGNASHPFTGIFDGKNHTISNFTISGTGESTGFFNVIKGATIKNLKLENVSVNGKTKVGALVGWAQVQLDPEDASKNLANLIGNCRASGSVSGTRQVGGLVGLNDGKTDKDTLFSIASSVNKVAFSGTVTGTNQTGGLVGANNGTITQGEASGTAKTNENAANAATIGGLVGDNTGSIYDSNADVDVSGINVVGGFVGYSDGIIKNAYSTGNVQGSSYVGSFAGSISKAENVIGAGTVTKTGESMQGYAGGFAGNMGGTIAGAASQITIKNAFGNCVSGDGTILGTVGNSNDFTSDSQKEILKNMGLTTSETVRDKLFEMFGVWLDTANESELADILANINAAMTAGISNTGNTPWQIADLTAYADLYAEGKMGLTEEKQQELLNYIIAQAAEATKAGDLAKYIIALKAMGYDACKVVTVNTPAGTYFNMVAQLKQMMKDKTGGADSIYSLPYILIALQQDDTYASKAEIQTLIQQILDQQLTSGGWGYNDGTADVLDFDTTAPIMLALSKYYDANPEVKDALDKVLAPAMIATAQGKTGAIYSSWSNAPSAETTGLVLAGLAACGKDYTDYKVGDKTLADGLMNMLNKDKNGFLFAGQTNETSTEQGFRGLLAALQAKNTGKAYNIYDFSSKSANVAKATGKGSTDKPLPPTGTDDIMVYLTVKTDTETWLEKAPVTVKNDATVYHAFTSGLDAAGMRENGAADGYVKSITKGDVTLAEFDKGKNSGWLYKVNNVLPNVPLTSYRLSDGDEILWYYTVDYKQDPAAGSWTEPAKDVVTTGKAGSAVTTSPTDVKVSERTSTDGTKEKVAEITVSADNQKEILKQAKENKSAEIVLNVAKDSVKDATKADIKLDKSFIDSIVKDTDAKLTVKTPLGDKTYTQDELKALSEASTGSTVTVTIEKAADQPTDDDAVKAEKIAKAKKLTASMKLTARTEKTAKKNIKVTVKTNSKTTASLKELKDLGYTVKYRYYRSAKKAAGYKSAVTKTTKSYINTAGTKGKMYYYKTQVRVYDENGKLIAKTALKQCKYANRKWSK